MCQWLGCEESKPERVRLLTPRSPLGPADPRGWRRKVTLGSVDEPPPLCKVSAERKREFKETGGPLNFLWGFNRNSLTSMFLFYQLQR